jgi:dsRNA-specific ribonuclease
MSFTRWEDNLKFGVERIAEIIEPENKERAKQITNKANMEIWKQVFTDSALSVQCYEPFESYGDKIAGVFVVEKAMEAFPGIQPKEITSLVAHYASNEVQGKLMMNYPVQVGERKVRKTFIEQYLRRPPVSTGATLTLAIYADMYEAILGGICTVGNKITRGLGMIYAARWFEFIFTKELKWKYSFGDSASILTGLFNRFEYYIKAKGGKGNVGIVFDKTDVTNPDTTQSTVIYKFFLSKPLIAFLQSLDRTLLSKEVRLPDSTVPIGWAEASASGEAREEAAKKALEELESKYGIDEEWATRTKNILDMEAIESDEEVSVPYNKIASYIDREGYHNLRFKNLAKHSKEGNRHGIQIIAQNKKTGEDRVFDTRVYPVGSAYEARKRIIKDFSNSLPSERRIR